MTGWAAIRLVAGREIRERLRAPSFKVATIVSAAVIAAIIIIPALRSSGGVPTYDVAVSGAPSEDVIESIEAAGRRAAVVLRVHPVPDDRLAEAQVRAGRYDIALLDDNRSLVIGDPLDPTDAGGRERAVAVVSEVVRVRTALEQAGVESTVAERILATPAPEVVATGRGDPDATAQAVAFVGVIVLFAFLQQYGSWVAYGVAEEKSSRVVEVLLSTTRPRDLLAGKVAGIGAVALSQGLVVAATAVGAMAIAGDGLPAGVTAGRIVAPLGWFLLGYAFYCWAYASAASLVGKQSDLQSSIFPVTLPILIGYFVSITASFGGEPSLLAKVLAYFPPTAPFLMLTLSGSGYVAPWQVALSAAITLASTVLLARMAASIYARSILRTGQRVRWTEAFRTRVPA